MLAPLTYILYAQSHCGHRGTLMPSRLAILILIIYGMSHEQLKAFVLEMFIHVHVSAGVINKHV